MTADQLRKSILQQAIQGKLVPQDPNDEPASVLLERIREEKARLVKEKKIKKEKSPSIIFRGEDNSHYEKFTLTGEIKCIDDEIPFDLPKGWEWCRIKDICQMQAGKNISASEISEEKNLEYQYRCIGGNGLRGYVKTYNTEGHFSIVGRQGVLCGCLNIEVGRFYATEHAVIVDSWGIITPLFMYYILTALNLNQYSTATAQPGLSVAKIIDTPFPLPPLAEQQRIVAKIEELMPLVEQYGRAQSELEALNSNIREQLKKSVLQYAIEGKLVPQCEEDGTAEDLLREIQAEKQRLYAEGKLKKKDLAHSTIFRGEDNKYYEQVGKTCVCIDDEIPFETPLSWRWVRVKDVVKINPKNENSDDTIAAFIPMDKIEATFLSQFSYTKVHWGEIKSAFTHFADGDIAFAKITPCFQNRKSMVLQNLPNGIGAGTTELKVLRPYGETIRPFFLMYFLETPYFIENASFKGTANQQRILVGYLENKLLPLPPLREQRKISNTITDFLRLLD